MGSAGGSLVRGCQLQLQEAWFSHRAAEVKGEPSCEAVCAHEVSNITLCHSFLFNTEEKKVFEPKQIAPFA